VGFFDFHHRAGTNLASLQSLFRLAARALCTAFLLAVALSRAQEPVPGPPPPLESTTAHSGPLAAIHGVVLNAATGSPLPRALVQIEGDADTGALTDGEGRFEIPGVPVGPQAVQIIKPGFVDQAFFPGGDAGWGIGPSMNHNILVAEQMPDLIFTMAPTNSIHGHILLSTGDAAQGIGVKLAKRTVEDGRAEWKPISTVKANSDGAYRFARLGNGEYALYTEPAMDSELANLLSAPGSDGQGSRNGFPSQLYPEASELAGAAKIHLSNGQDTEANLSLTLQPFHTVTAQAMLPSGHRYGDENPAWAGMALTAQVLDAQGHPLRCRIRSGNPRAARPSARRDLLVFRHRNLFAQAGRHGRKQKLHPCHGCRSLDRPGGFFRSRPRYFKPAHPAPGAASQSLAGHRDS
jgi:hypothetical protein